MIVNLKTIPWKRALLKAERGEVDVIPMITRSEERSAYLLFTTPVYTDPIKFIYSAEYTKDFKWDQWTDLKPYKIGIVRGYSYGTDWDKAVKEFDLNTHNLANDLQGVKMLLKGRIDLLPLFYANGSNMIKELQVQEKLKFNHKAINNNSKLHFGISKKSFLADKVPEINLVLQTMQDDETFKMILKDLYNEE